MAGGTRQLTAAEIEARKPVWIAMSDLFLDTRLRKHDHQHIASAIRQAGLAAAQAKGILLNELFPALLVNFQSVAGEWAGFDESWLIDRVLQQREPGFTGRFRLRFHFWLVAKDWHRVVQLLDVKEHNP